METCESQEVNETCDIHSVRPYTIKICKELVEIGCSPTSWVVENCTRSSRAVDFHHHPCWVGLFSDTAALKCCMLSYPPVSSCTKLTH